jgi:hypothetical protein
LRIQFGHPYAEGAKVWQKSQKDSRRIPGLDSLRGIGRVVLNCLIPGVGGD